MSDTDKIPEHPVEAPDMAQTFSLPDVAKIELSAPLGWLSGAWGDFTKAPLPCLIYGIVLAGISAMIAWALVFSGAFAWIFVLAGGFFLVAPILAMGLYEAGKQIEEGKTPSLGDVIVVKSAFRSDLAYLGLALFLIYLLWTRVAQVVYALSTNTLHKTPTDFLTFMFTTPDGQMMALTGTVIGAIIGLLAYMMVVISAPMMLDSKRDVWTSTITSIRAVLDNPMPMLFWALIIAVLTAIGIATAFFGLIIIFPLIGLASWRAYRELVPNP